MVTRNVFTLGKSLAVGLLVGLLTQQSAAAEQPAANDNVGVSVDSQVFKQGIEAYIKTINQELKATLEQEAKRAAEPKLELASADARGRG